MDDTRNEPLLRRASAALNVPPMLVQPGVEELDTPVKISDDTAFPKPTFTRYTHNARKQRMPQCIAHRGYKASFPENTMLAFREAVKAGTHALETDVHITKDDVVVLSHDATLKRCFGREDKIKDLEWKEVAEARSLSPPHEPMPRLIDLLEYMAEPGMEEIWLLLDIKLDNDADAIMRLIGSTIASVPPSAKKAWSERILLGIWAAKFLPLAVKHIPGFPITHIGFSTSYARHFFTVPNVSFNMLIPMLVAPGGRRFIRDARGEGREVYAWTANDKDKIEWCIRRKLDGVCTDDVAKFLAICEDYDEEKTPTRELRWKVYWDFFRVWLWVTFAAWLYRKRFMPVASRALIQKAA